MVYIVSTLLRKASEKSTYTKGWRTRDTQHLWTDLMLEPKDYGY